MRLIIGALWALLVFNFYALADEEIDIDELKCEVCKVTVGELEKQLSKIDPKKRIEVGGATWDDKGNEIRKTVPMRQSEVFISEKIDTLCSGMDNYARVRDKVTRQIRVMNLMDSKGGMNALLSDYDFVTDGDMNKSVKYYCENLVEEYEDEIIETMKKGAKNAKYSICTQATNMCSDEPEDDEETEPYVDESHAEL